MAPEVAGEDIVIRRRRLQYRAAHRGTRELDLLLGPFAATEIGDMDATALDGFETLLEETETELQAWLLGQAEPPVHFAPLVARILSHKQASFEK